MFESGRTFERCNEVLKSFNVVFQPQTSKLFHITPHVVPRSRDTGGDTFVTTSNSFITQVKRVE
jgi:hypothetical protein